MFKRTKIAYFKNPTTNLIDEAKLISTIEGLVRWNINGQKELINQMIVYEFTLRLLNAKIEKKTKAAFDTIKKSGFSLVIVEKPFKEDFFRLYVDEVKLLKQLRSQNISPSFDTEDTSNKVNASQPGEQELKVIDNANSFEIDGSSSQISNNSIVLGLIPDSKPKLNLDLLAKCIEAYVFKAHYLDFDVTTVDIHARQKRMDISCFKSIRRFLKWDLQHISFSNKGYQLGFGLKYDVRRKIVTFFGRVEDEIKNKTLIIQIQNRRSKILKEFWVQGVEFEPESELLKHEVEGVY